jgi:DHA1 family inner membrane transport protein
VLSAAVAAAAEWAPPGQRARVLSWTLLGQPAAWVVGMPLAGVVADDNWRLAWLTVPLVASLVALAAVRCRPRSAPASALKTNWRSLARNRAVAGWALGELLAFAGWSGTLIYCGALLVESYGASAASVGLVLAGSAVAYFPGNFLVRRVVDRAARPLLVGLGAALAVGVAIFGVARPSLAFSAVLFAGLVFLAGGRTLAGSAVGLHSAPEDRLAVTRARAAATQFGYLLGAGAGGGALAVGGYSALGVVLATLFAGAVLPQIALALHARLSSADSAADALGLARAR